MYSFRVINDLITDLDKMFQFDNCKTFTTNYSNYSYQALSDDDNFYYIKMLVAGVDKEDILIKYKEEYGVNKVYVEVLKDSDFVHKFKKSYTIGSLAEIKNATAQITNGILVISIPKNKDKMVEGKIIIS